MISISGQQGGGGQEVGERYGFTALASFSFGSLYTAAAVVAHAFLVLLSTIVPHM